MLSGGIDSASIAGIARGILPEMPDLELHTFSVVSDEVVECAETQNILAIVKGYEEYAHLVSVPSFTGIITDNDLREAAWTHAHPVGNSILLPAMMYLTAQRYGHRVMYDGIDGDLVTHTPIRYMVSMLRSGTWREAWAEARKASVNNTYLRHLSPVTILAKSACEAYAPSSVKWLKRRIWNVGGKRLFSRNLISPDFAANIRLSERLEQQWSLSQRVSQLSDQETHIRALTPTGITTGMEGFDRVAARHGIEPRHPWSDKRLVEFYLRLPLRQKARDGWTKYLLRKAMAPLLDADVRWHTGKDHFGMRLVRRLMEQSHEQIQNTLRTVEGSIGKYVDINLFYKLLRRYETGTDDSELYQLYEVVTLTRWLDRIGMAAN